MNNETPPAVGKPHGGETVRSLAATLGVNHRQVVAWVKRADWPFGGPPWTTQVVERIEAWRQEGFATPLDPAHEASEGEGPSPGGSE